MLRAVRADTPRWIKRASNAPLTVGVHDWHLVEPYRFHREGRYPIPALRVVAGPSGGGDLIR